MPFSFLERIVPYRYYSALRKFSLATLPLASLALFQITVCPAFWGRSVECEPCMTSDLWLCYHETDPCTDLYIRSRCERVGVHVPVHFASHHLRYRRTTFPVRSRGPLSSLTRVESSRNRRKHPLIGCHTQGGPKKRYPCFIFAITSVNVHRF